MKMNAYVTFDYRSEMFDGIILFRTDKHALFEMTRRLKEEVREYTLLCCIGHFDVLTGEFTPEAVRSLPWMDLSVDDVSSKIPISSDPPQKQVVDFLNKTS